MDLKRFQEWAGTAQGLGTTLIAFVVMLTTMWATSTDVLGRILGSVGLSQMWWPRAGSALIIVIFGLVLWRSFRRFVQASRLEQPDAFTLRPTSPETLIGRAEDLARLVSSVKQYRLVLLDGESGCGKSALVSAGLVPVLQQSDSLLPVATRDWGDDWVRGPLSAALDALYHAVSEPDRNRFGWTAPPDLAAETPKLAADLEARLKAVTSTLGRRTLLVADQFDDYQAGNRSRFLDNNANWITPTALARDNRFWGLVRSGLVAGHMHLLVVARADTAASLSCIRFLGEDMTATRTLARVEAEYLRPLLAGIAPDGADPPVVSHPEGGWRDLREQLERDLKAEGAILMQQVRTVMLGLRQLGLLTPRHYRAAGGLRGVETMVIARAVRRAGEAAGPGEAGRRTARTMLSALVIPGGPDQPPKARRALFSQLRDLVGDAARTDAMLGVLQHEEVVRPAEAVSGESAWQLDHDYLARAVLAEARQANRWTIALREGKASYDAAVGNWRRRYAALLPVSTLVRLCWERARNRLRFGAAAGYARTSAIKPAVAVLCLTLIGLAANAWNQSQLLTAEADRLIIQFGGSSAAEALLQTWRAPEPLRQRVYDRVRTDEGRLELAVWAGWPLAHAGFELARVQEAHAAIRKRLAREPSREVLLQLLEVYAALAPRFTETADLKTAIWTLRPRLQQPSGVDDALALERAYSVMTTQLTRTADIKAEAVILRTRMEQEPEPVIASVLAKAYAPLAARLNDTAELKAGAASLRTQLVLELGFEELISGALDGYRLVAGKLKDAADVKAEATALRALFGQASDPQRARSLGLAYSAVTARLNDAADLKAEVEVLRSRLAQEGNSLTAYCFVGAYGAMAARLTEASEVKAAAAELRARLAREPNIGMGAALVRAYVGVAPGLKDAAAVKAEAAALRAWVEHERGPHYAQKFAVAYPAVAGQLNHASDVRTEAVALRTWLKDKRSPDTAAAFARAYAAVAGRLNDAAAVKAEAVAMRELLQHEWAAGIAEMLEPAYTAVVSRLNETADLTEEAAAMRTRLEQETPRHLAPTLIQPFATVAMRLNDSADLKTAAAVLRKVVDRRPEPIDVLSYIHTYAAVAAQLNDAAGIKATAASLRSRLAQERDGNAAGSLAKAYAVIAVRLREAADVKAEAAALRTRLEQERNPEISDSLARAYAAIGARLSDTADLKAEAAALRTRLEQEQDGRIASSFARAYAAVAGTIIKHADEQGRAALVLEILTLTGHPLLRKPEGLLDTLIPASRVDFGDNIGAAMLWAVKTYWIRPERMHPSPLPHQAAYGTP